MITDKRSNGFHQSAGTSLISQVLWKEEELYAKLSPESCSLSPFGNLDSNIPVTGDFLAISSSKIYSSVQNYMVPMTSSPVDGLSFERIPVN